MTRLSTLVRLALAAELAAYAAIGAWLHARGVHGGVVIAAIALFAFGGRLAFVLATIALAARAARPRPAAERLGPAAATRLAVTEYAALLANNYFYLPFPQWSVPPDPPPSPSARTPVVLVHGYFSSRGYFRSLRRSLLAAGIGPVFAPSFPAAFVPIERYVAALDAELERIAAASGRGRVILVCHSMGGLAARRYLASRGAARVERLVTIASPHGGTALAPLGVGENARQMEFGSAFLAGLVEDEEGKARCPTTCFFTPHDNMVSPPATCRLAWAKNVALPGLGHISILLSPRLHAAVVAELRP